MLRRISRWLAVGFVVTVTAAGVFMGIASAGRLSYSNQSFRDVSAEGTFESERGERGLRIRCPVTLSGSLSARTFGKVVGTRVGQLTSATVAEASCTGEGEVEFERTGFPTALTYRSFQGTLPNITGIRFASTIPDMTNKYRERFGLNYSCKYTYDPLLDIIDITRIKEMGRWKYQYEGTLTLRPMQNMLCPPGLIIRIIGPARTPEGAELTITLI